MAKNCDGPLVTCILPAHNGAQSAAPAIEDFLRQYYAPRELIVIDDAVEPIEALIPTDPRIRYFRLESRLSQGAALNFACHQARGEIILHWDEDTWRAPHYILLMLNALLREQAEVCGLNHVLSYHLKTGEAWRQARKPHESYWVHPSSFCYRRSTWDTHPFSDAGGKDLDGFLISDSIRCRVAVSDWTAMLCLIRESNSDFWTAGMDAEREPCEVEIIRRLVGRDAERYGIAIPDIRSVTALPHSQKKRRRHAGRRRKRPLVSCVLLAQDQRFAGLAIEYFMRQKYDPRELIIVGGGRDWIEELAARDERIHYRESPFEMTAGSLLNMACERAGGEIIAVWTESAWYSDQYLQCMVEGLLDKGADLTGLNAALFYELRSGNAWLYEYPFQEPSWPASFSPCFRRKLWDRNRFPDVNSGECARFIWNAQDATLSVVQEYQHCIAVIRSAESRFFDGPYWKPHPLEEIRRLLGNDWQFYEPQLEVSAQPSTRKSSINPLVSCILPVRAQRHSIGLAIEYFRRQDYEHRELIVVDDGTDPVEDLIPSDECFRYLRLERKISTGAKRNLACEQSRGDIIIHWDNDAWYAPRRISYMVQALLREGADLCGLNPVLFFDLASGQGRLYRESVESGFWAHISSFCYRRSFWDRNRFSDLDFGEDLTFLSEDPSAHRLVLPDFSCQIIITQEYKIAIAKLGGSHSQAFPEEEVRRLLGDDWYFYESEIKHLTPVRIRGFAAVPRTPFPKYPRVPLPVDKPAIRKFVSSQPLVSCIMPTRDRRLFASLAIESFLCQDYESRELIIVDDGDEAIKRIVPDDERIRYFRLDKRSSIGAKRNYACEQARGEVIIHWDDDDWHAPYRIRSQAEELLRLGADVCGLDPLPALDLATGLAWSYRCPIHEGYWAAGGSFCYRRTLWERNRFADVDLAEDRQFLWNARGSRMIQASDSSVLVAMIHGKNAALREPGDSCWSLREVEERIRILGSDWGRYQSAFRMQWPVTSAAVPMVETAAHTMPPPPSPHPLPEKVVGRPRPLVSCIMPTRNRSRFVPMAVQYFLRQDYEPKEMIVVDDGSDPIESLIPHDDCFHYVRLTEKISVGAKRNLACSLAHGEIIMHWDDDDWQAPRRISSMVEPLLREDVELCGLNPILFFDIRSGMGWLYHYPPGDQFWVAGTSLCYRRRFWEKNHFADLDVGEDTQFVWSDGSARMLAVPQLDLQVAILHDENGSPKATDTAFWSAHPADEVQRLLGPDLNFYGFALPFSRLNLGCGDAHLSGMWNVDIVPPADQIVDLRETWPWPDSSVDFIRAHDVIEHLPDKIRTMNEAWRVLQPGGKIEIAVPTTDGPGAFQDPTHQSFWNRRSFLYFESGNPYRERFAQSYAIVAAFRVVSDQIEMTENGPRLTIVLETVK
jgi:glycosyltransferase involved in cell wall biosynthesis